MVARPPDGVGSATQLVILTARSARITLPQVRTTITPDPEVAAQLKELAHRRRSSFKATLNEMLRRGMAAQLGEETRPTRFKVKPHRGGFRPGVDPAKLNQLADDLEVEDFAAEQRQRG